jgi:selenobiotic family peptide radical SAM maturase
VSTSLVDTYQIIFPCCRRILGNQTWGRILSAIDQDASPQIFVDRLPALQRDFDLPAFIADLGRIEWAVHCTRQDTAEFDRNNETTTVNPTLTLIPVAWQNLVRLLKEDSLASQAIHAATGVHVMIWRQPQTASVQIREADDIDLLALKITVEQIPPEKAADQGGVSVGAIESALYQAVSKGLLLAPASRIQRNGASTRAATPDLESYLTADIFTLQWHITQACDLKCKHCYDRSDRTAMPLDTALAILEDFHSFCRDMHVRGQVSFTGGNPLLYPGFKDIYQETAAHGFGIAILGNPTPAREIEALAAIAKPVYFQISLEGLENHNDAIRGKGHFNRSLAFLDELRNLDIYTMVMLTLTRDNMNQVLPLAELLRDRADFFTFNRLSAVGEGAQLKMAEPLAFKSWLKDFVAAARENPILGLKDNLINIIRQETGQKFFGGCTGYGCGAAFNFVALLADGEVHACRKFPSPIGNMRQDRLMDIYHSPGANAYRTGSQACAACSLNIVCRGCLAITYSEGLDVFKDRDPFCFIA